VALFGLAKIAAPQWPHASSTVTFDASVQPFLALNCQPCHNAKLSTAGLNLAAFKNVSSLEKDRDRWEQIVSKIVTGQNASCGDAAA
jgi:hypothetical protein